MSTMKKHNLNFYLEVSLYLVIALSFVYFFFKGNRDKCFQALLVMCTLYIIRILITLSKIWLPEMIKSCILGFIFIAMVLGNEFQFYTLIPIWDKILHSLSGILLTSLGFLIYVHINKDSRNNIESPLTATLFSMFFAIAAAGCWEIFEFTVDHLMGLNCQKGSLFDTMTDIICGTSGAIVSSIYLFNKIKSRNAASIVYNSGKGVNL